MRLNISISLRLLLVLGIVSIWLFGCKSTKTSTTKTANTATDTVRIKEVIYVKDSSHTTAPVNTHIELPNPCDSLGRLVAYYQTIKVGNDSITVDTRSGNLVINANKKGTNNRQLTSFSSKDSSNSSTQKSESQTVDKEVEVKTIYPWWLIIYAAITTVISAFTTYLFFNTLFIKLKQ